MPAVRGTEADLTPYCIRLPPTDRCYWSVKAHQRPKYHVVTTSGQSISSAILPAFSFKGVSAAKPLMVRTYIWPTWPALCLHEKGVVYCDKRSSLANGRTHVSSLSVDLPTIHPLNLSALLREATSSRASRALTTLPVCNIVLMINR